MDEMKAMKTALANIKKLARESLIGRHRAKLSAKEEPALPLEDEAALDELAEEEPLEEEAAELDLELDDEPEPKFEIMTNLRGRKAADGAPKKTGRFQKKK